MIDEATTTDPETPTGEIPDELASLREQLARAEKENGDLLRHLAEYQTRHGEMQAVVRRNNADVEQKLRFGHEKFALDMLTALDNLDRAIDAAKKAGDKGPLAIGVMSTQAQLKDVLKRHAIVAIESVGKPFDPNLHQAVQSEPPMAGQAPNTVTTVLQEGFTLHDRVLRPAMVIVAQG